MWESENDVEVVHRQQGRRFAGHPACSFLALAFRAVPIAAGVVGDPPMPALAASFDVSPEGCGPTACDGSQDTAPFA